ncbi:uncharacterized protein LOC100700150 isoform X3 [Oreochromis niloticus]|uniref:uncharacterized protein LOC100700150 isoform X3 n=1 Tax=Oreochromis niloticus TaxID=8128 RepID=UPI00022B2ABE|nr:uncharacterized protein LOC100700150 isoform X3 [Oreochromis niloticus]
MFSNFAPHPRLLVFVPICAAIVLFIVCPDSARASYTATQKQNGAMYNAWRQLYTPYSQHRPASTGLLSTETGLHTGTDDETETSGNYRRTTSIIDLQSKPLQITQAPAEDLNWIYACNGLIGLLTLEMEQKEPIF